MIKEFDNFILLGTSHVSKDSAREIKEVLDKNEIELVCIELDYPRFKSLMNQDSNSKKKKKVSLSMIKEFGFSGFIFALIAGFVQNSAGKYLNVDPGIDMKTAYLEARSRKIPTALIDLNIKLTLQKISKLSFSRKMKMFSKLVTANFKKENREKLNFDIKKGVPDDNFIEEVLKVVEKEVPDMYKILIADRNEYMVDKLIKLKPNHSGKILVVVGAGHVAGMLDLLKLKLVGDDFSYSYVAEVE